MQLGAPRADPQGRGCPLASLMGLGDSPISPVNPAVHPLIGGLSYAGCPSTQVELQLSFPLCSVDDSPASQPH
jgi:hypothetical protein